MKRLLFLIILIIISFIFSGCFFDNAVKGNPIFTDFDDTFEAKVEKVEDTYTGIYDYQFPKNPWDMQSYNNKIFIGSGDFDRNSGYCTMKYFDTKSQEMNSAGVAGTEQISRFYIIDNELYSTAIDPVAWGVGDYYKYSKDNNSFDTYSVFPSNIHCFDMIKYDNKFFFCGSVENYDYASMIMYIPEDKMDSSLSKNTEQIYLFKDGKQIDRCYRVYELFEFQGNLYAWHYQALIGDYDGLYIYNKEKCRFDYCENEKTIQPVIKKGHLFINGEKYNTDYTEAYLYLQHDFLFKDKMCFINEGLYYTEDLKNYTTCDLGEENKGFIVKDAIERDGYLYVLANKKIAENNYETAVFLTKDLKTFKKMCYFNKKSYMLSFEYDNGVMLFGEGEPNKKEIDSCGNLYKLVINKGEK